MDFIKRRAWIGAIVFGVVLIGAGLYMVREARAAPSVLSVAARAVALVEALPLGERFRGRRHRILEARGLRIALRNGRRRDPGRDRARGETDSKKTTHATPQHGGR